MSPSPAERADAVPSRRHPPLATTDCPSRRSQCLKPSASNTGDTYAVQQRNGSYVRVGSEPLLLPLLWAHVEGRITLGTYLLDAQETCSFAVFDDDRDDGLMWLAVLAGELAREGISTMVEASRRGGHLWIHFAEPRPGYMVRAWLLPYAQAFGMELYPKQDALDRGMWGSLIRLPLGVHQRSRGWYPFVVVLPSWKVLPVWDTIEDCLAWAYTNVQRVQVPLQHELMSQEHDGVCRNNVQEALVSPAVSGRMSIREWCQSQDIVSVIGRYVALDRRGVGSCPFPGHHHRGDIRPSFQVFGEPDSHWYCYTWRRAGDLFTFLCLYYGLTPKEGYARLLQGTLIA